MKLMLFLGSGVSYPSGMPGVGEITRSILNDEWHSHTDQLFYSGPQKNPTFTNQNWVLRIQPFLQPIKAYSDAYYSVRSGAEANYEDLYYLARQIADDELGEIDNPGIQGFSSEIKNKTQHLCTPFPMTNEEVTYGSLARRACDFIQCAVRHRLYTEKYPKGMDLIEELASSTDIKGLDIVTLNHDCLVENLLQSRDIHFADGFGLLDGEVSFFDPSCYDTGIRIRLFKLHGSINWFLYRTKEDGVNIDRYGRTKQPDFWHCRDSKGNFLMNMGGMPIFLVGTYNKIFDYGSGIHAEMYFRFYQLLKEYNLVVMSGYGWNDRGINTRLMEWLFSSRDKRLYLLHRNPEEIKDKSKSGMWHWYGEFVRDGRLVPIKKWLCEIDKGELFKAIGRKKDDA